MKTALKLLREKAYAAHAAHKHDMKISPSYKAAVQKIERSAERKATAEQLAFESRMQSIEQAAMPNGETPD